MGGLEQPTRCRSRTATGSRCTCGIGHPGEHEFPEEPPVKLCTLPEAARLAGVEYRTAHSWIMGGVFAATYPSAGKGRPALLDDSALALVILLGRLRRVGLGMDVLRDVASRWEDHAQLSVPLGEGITLVIEESA
jgi:hypothetical protein